MDGKLIRAAQAVLLAHEKGDSTETAASGVALAHLVMEQAKTDASADTPSASFSFPLEPEPKKA
jgi:hypothetical protein